MRLTTVLSLLCALVFSPVLTAQDRGHRRSSKSKPQIHVLKKIADNKHAETHKAHSTIKKNIQVVVVGESDGDHPTFRIHVDDGDHGSHGKSKECNCDCHNKGCPRVSAHGSGKGIWSSSHGKGQNNSSSCPSQARGDKSGKARGKSRRPSFGSGRGSKLPDMVRRFMSGDRGEKIREMIQKRMGARGGKGSPQDLNRRNGRSLDRGRRDRSEGRDRNSDRGRRDRSEGRGRDSDRGRRDRSEGKKKAIPRSGRQRFSRNSDGKGSPLEGIARQFMSGNPEDSKRMMDMAQQFMSGGGDGKQNKAMMDMARQFLQGEQGEGIRKMIMEQAGPEAGAMIQQFLQREGRNDNEEKDEIHLEDSERSEHRRSREVNLENEERENRLNEIDEMIGNIHHQMDEIHELLESLRNDG